MTGPGKTPKQIPPLLRDQSELRWWIWLLAMLVLAGLWKTQRRAKLGLALLMLMGLAWTACSVGGSEKPAYTPSGSYLLVVTATSTSGLVHNVTFGLTVK
jgi:hypothetical protein